MNKYYTPELEEFHVGFEYEVQTWKDKWETETLIDLNSQDSDGALYPWIPTEQSLSCFRVKYLNKEDIESLGFILDKVNEDKNQEIYSKDNIIMHYRYDTHQLGIITKDPSKNDYYSKYNKDPYSIHSIVIKNKSELKKLLKQLKIIE